MAVIFQIWIESEENGLKIRDYFSAKNKIVVNQKHYKIKTWSSGKTGSMITVDGISNIGIQSTSEAKEMTEIGFQFYALLKNAPDFRYALTGVEVDGWLEMEDLHKKPNSIETISGLVINKKIYEQIKCTSKMEAFKENYLWIPYTGETFTERIKS